MPPAPKKKAVTIFVVLTVFLLALVLIYYFVLQTKNLNVVNQDAALFSDSINLPPDDLANLTTNTEGLKQLSLILSPTSIYWQRWTFPNSYVVAEVTKLFPEFNEVVVRILLPDNQPFSNKSLRVDLACDDDAAVVLKSRTFDVIESSASAKEVLEVGDIIHGVCSDEAICGRLHGSCVILKK